MKEVTRYQCQYCKKDFRTPNQHYCKFNPALKNCFTCKHLKGWENGDQYDAGYEYPQWEPNFPDCVSGEANIMGYDIELIKQLEYDMQCERWEEGKYDWRKEND